MTDGLYDPRYADEMSPDELFEVLKNNGIKSPEAPPITVERLDDAIANVLGAEVAAAMQVGCVARPSRHAAAIQRAFTYGCADEDARVLRQAQIMLDTNGAYEFS